MKTHKKRRDKNCVKSKNLKVIVQKWEESEKGWGVRSDGFSLHLTDADRKAFIREYWDGMPKTIPDEYSRISGTPYTATVNATMFAKVKASKNGIRCDGRPPGSGGSDS